MPTVKENIISGIQNIQDEEFLMAVWSLVFEKQAADTIVPVSDLHRQAFEHARKEYEAGRFYTTDELFADLEE